MAIKVRLKTLKNGNEEIIHPETDWSVVLNRPSITVDSNGETWSNGSSIRLNENKIYVKDEATGNSEKPLADYPINWSAVKNGPTFTFYNSSQTWSASNSGIRLYGGRIYIKDHNSDYKKTLEDYPIKWSAISEKPAYLLKDQNYITFGYRRHQDNPPEGGFVLSIFPAIRTFVHIQKYGENTYTHLYYYFNNENNKNSWDQFTNSDEFIPGL